VFARNDRVVRTAVLEGLADVVVVDVLSRDLRVGG
jgi:hypothetical protein